MADNTTLNTGSGGDVIATDDIGGVKYTRVKVVLGADGTNGGDVSATNPVPVEAVAGTGTGTSVFRTLDLSTTGQVVKASAGKLYGYIMSNTNLGTVFVKFYNKATAPTEADTPVITVVMPQNNPTPPFSIDPGVTFSSGISIRASTNLADNDTTAPTTNAVVANIFYK